MTALNKAVCVGAAESIDRELEELQDRATDVYMRVAQVHLQELEERYPRHKFLLYDGMGSTFLSIDPPFLGNSHLAPLYFPPDGLPQACKPIVGDLVDKLNEIVDLCNNFTDTWHCELGVVRPDGM